MSPGQFTSLLPVGAKLAQSEWDFTHEGACGKDGVSQYNSLGVFPPGRIAYAVQAGETQGYMPVSKSKEPSTHYGPLSRLWPFPSPTPY